MISNNNLLSGIYRAKIMTIEGNKARLYIPAIMNKSINELNISKLPLGIFLCNDENAKVNAACWISFEAGDIRYPQIMGYLTQPGITITNTKVSVSTSSSNNSESTSSNTSNNYSSETNNNFEEPIAIPQSNASDKATEALQYALSTIGVPYVWGGTSLSGFDCSGLVNWAFGKAGIKVSRTTGTLINDGVKVNGIENALPGDIAFPSARNGKHVVILVNPAIGEYIHAPSEGKTVEISTYHSKIGFSHIRRLA